MKRLDFLLIGLLLILIASPLEGGITLQAEKTGEEFVIGKGQWLAPFGLKVAASEKLTSLGLVFSDLEKESIAEVAVFQVSGEYNKSLVNFPQDWRRLEGEVKKEEFPKVQVNFSKGLTLPASFENRFEFLVGFRLEENIKGPLNFSVTLSYLSFEKNKSFLSLKANVSLDDKAPEIKVNSEKLRFSDDLSGIRIKVETDEPLAFPAQIKPEFGWDPEKKAVSWVIRDYHGWKPPEKRVTSRISMSRVKDNCYQYDYLFLSPLSENDKDIKEKTISYSLEPNPDSWRWRKDDTGYDLIDGDARNGWFTTGAIRWIGATDCTISFDLKKVVPVGRIILYCWEDIDEIKFFGKREEKEEWQKIGFLPGPSFPLYQYYIEPYLSLYAAEVNFPSLPQVRYLKILLSGGNLKTVTEVEIWGISSLIVIPEGFTIYATDRAGNATRYYLKIEK